MMLVRGSYSRSALLTAWHSCPGIVLSPSSDTIQEFVFSSQVEERAAIYGEFPGKHQIRRCSTNHPGSHHHRHLPHHPLMPGHGHAHVAAETHATAHEPLPGVPSAPVSAPPPQYLNVPATAPASAGHAGSGANSSTHGMCTATFIAPPGAFPLPTESLPETKEAVKDAAAAVAAAAGAAASSIHTAISAARAAAVAAAAAAGSASGTAASSSSARAAAAADASSAAASLQQAASAAADASPAAASLQQAASAAAAVPAAASPAATAAHQAAAAATHGEAAAAAADCEAQAAARLQSSSLITKWGLLDGSAYSVGWAPHITWGAPAIAAMSAAAACELVLMPQNGSFGGLWLAERLFASMGLAYDPLSLLLMAPGIMGMQAFCCTAKLGQLLVIDTLLRATTRGKPGAVFSYSLAGPTAPPHGWYMWACYALIGMAGAAAVAEGGRKVVAAVAGTTSGTGAAASAGAPAAAPAPAAAAPPATASAAPAAPAVAAAAVADAAVADAGSSSSGGGGTRRSAWFASSLLAHPAASWLVSAWWSLRSLSSLWGAPAATASVSLPHQPPSEPAACEPSSEASSSAIPPTPSVIRSVTPSPAPPRQSVPLTMVDEGADWGVDPRMLSFKHRWAIDTCLLTPVLEETLFRGFLLTSLTKFMPVWGAVGVSALAFAAAHMSWEDAPQVAATGVVLGYAFVRSRSLAAPIAAHAINNASVVLATCAHEGC